MAGEGDSDTLELVIEHVFRIKDRGTVVACRRRSGDLRDATAGLRISVTRPDGASIATSIRGVEFSTPPPPPDVMSLLLPQGASAQHVVPGAVIRARRRKLSHDELFERGQQLILAEFRRQGGPTGDFSETVWGSGPTYDPDDRFSLKLYVPAERPGEGILLAQARLDWYTGAGEARVWPDRVPQE